MDLHGDTELLTHAKQKLHSKSDIFNLNTPFPLLQRGEKFSGISLFPRGGRGCCLIYILVKAKL